MKSNDNIIQTNNIKYYNPEIEKSLKNHSEENIRMAEQKEKELLEKYSFFSDVIVSLCLLFQKRKNKQK